MAQYWITSLMIWIRLDIGLVTSCESNRWIKVDHDLRGHMVSPDYNEIIHLISAGSYPRSIDQEFLAATKQLNEWYFLSVCPSVCPSVTPFWLCFHYRIIMKFSGVITRDQGKVHAKGQGRRSKVKVTEVTTQLNRFRTVTPV